MSDLVKNILRFTVFILIQVYVLFKVPHLHRFITPYLYYLFHSVASVCYSQVLVVGDRFYNWPFIGLFYPDSRTSCSGLFADCLYPPFYHQSVVAKR